MEIIVGGELVDEKMNRKTMILREGVHGPMLGAQERYIMNTATAKSNGFLNECFPFFDETIRKGAQLKSFEENIS